MKTTHNQTATPRQEFTFYKNFFCGGGYFKTVCRDFLSLPTAITKLKGKN